MFSDWDSHNHVVVHEVGHALLAYILTSRAGDVTINRDESGRHRRPWSKTPGLADDTAAVFTAGALMDVAGPLAEELILGRADAFGASHDYLQASDAIRVVQGCPGFAHVTLPIVKGVVKYLLRMHRRALDLGIKEVQPAWGSAVGSARLDDQFSYASYTLGEYYNHPLLAGHWPETWRILMREAWDADQGSRYRAYPSGT